MVGAAPARLSFRNSMRRKVLPPSLFTLVDGFFCLIMGIYSTKRDGSALVSLSRFRRYHTVVHKGRSKHVLSLQFFQMRWRKLPILETFLEVVHYFEYAPCTSNGAWKLSH